MEIISYISNLAIPLMIIIIVATGFKEKKKVYDIFLKGATATIEIVFKLYPTLLALFLAIGLLRESGIIEFITKLLLPITSLIGMPSEIVPLALIRPISGSSSIAVATDIMKNYGVDSKIGLMSSIIMGATETTIYTIAVYTSCCGIKKIKYVLVASLIGDLVGIMTAIFICKLGII